MRPRSASSCWWFLEGGKAFLQAHWAESNTTGQNKNHESIKGASLWQHVNAVDISRVSGAGDAATRARKEKKREDKTRMARAAANSG